MRRLPLPALLAAALAVGCGGSFCPSGTTKVGAGPPEGFDLHCEKPAVNGRAVMHGPSRTWYPSGRPKRFGTYVDGAAVGYWQLWYESGQLKEEGDMPNGIRWNYYENGRPSLVSQYDGKMRVGHWQSWYEDGTLKTDAVYPEGPAVGWFPGNVKGWEGRSFNGSRHGWWRFWGRDGTKTMEGAYAFGREEGPWIYYVREPPERRNTVDYVVVYMTGKPYADLRGDQALDLAACLQKEDAWKCCEQVEVCRRRFLPLEP